MCAKYDKLVFKQPSSYISQNAHAVAAGMARPEQGLTTAVQSDLKSNTSEQSNPRRKLVTWRDALFAAALSVALVAAAIVVGQNNRPPKISGTANSSPPVSFRMLIISFIVGGISLYALSASAMSSEPEGLRNSGPVRVAIDTSVGTTSKVIDKDALKAHVENRLLDAAIQTSDDPGEAALIVNVSARMTGNPPVYLIDIYISHNQSAVLARDPQVRVSGIDWQDAWALIVANGADPAVEVNKAVDEMVADFVRSYVSANRTGAQ